MNKTKNNIGKRKSMEGKEHVQSVYKRCDRQQALTSDYERDGEK